MRDNMNSRLVYSTDQGKTCPKCRCPMAQCVCKQQKAPASKGDGVVRVGRETKGRKGKGVTIITGLPLAGDQLQALATQLKKRCGSGGTVKDGTIEIQGDHRDALVLELTKQGYTVIKAGG